nr:efflux RND transporter periplasmic adaptor subunit [Candidatus Gracilibacteria bacterium]
MKKIAILFLLLAISTSLTSCGKIEEKVQKYYKTSKVQTGSINLEDNFVGYVESETKTDIGSKQGGLIREIYVKEGDYVNAGDIIAKIDSAESNISLSNQEIMLQQMQDLKNSVSKSYDSQIEVTKSLENQININLKGAKDSLEITKSLKDKELSSISSQVETSKNALETAKIELEQTKLVLDTKEKNLYSNGKNAITNSMIVDTNTIKFADSILGVINLDKNNTNYSLNTYLGAKNTSQKNQVKQDFENVYSDYLKYKSLYETTILNKNPSNEEIENTLKIGIQFNDSLRNFLKDFYETMDNSIPNGSNLSQADIDNYKQKISDLGASIEQSLISVSGNYTLGLKGSSQSIDDFKTEKEKTLSLLQKKVDLASNNLDTINKNYEQATEGNNLKITDIETKTNEAAEKINEIEKNRASIETSKNAKISELNLENQKLELSKDLSIVSINNSIIRAPISGVVTKKYVEIGQVIMPSAPLVQISNPDDTKVNFELPDNILSKIKLGDKVNLGIEGMDNINEGIVKTIYPTKNEITKKTKIEIKVNNSNNIKIGSIAKLYVKDTSQSGIFIKNSSIIGNYMIPGVYVLKAEYLPTDKSESGYKNFKTIEFRQIKIIKQNDEFSLVDGLKVGEEIITDGKENLFDGESLE